MNRDPVPDSAMADTGGLLRVWVWGWPLVCALAVFWATRPGYLSFDSALMFWQARHGEYFDIGGVLLPWLWHLLQVVDAGTDAIRFVLMLGLASGLSACAWALRGGLSRRRIWVLGLVLPLCPLLWMLWPHVWTDVLLAALLCWLMALCLHMTVLKAAGVPGWVLLSAMVVLSVAVCLARHNGLFALPVLIWMGLASLFRWQRVLVGLATVLVLVGVVSVAGVLRGQLVTQRLDTWAVTLLWDLQAVSVAAMPDDARSLIPANLTGPDMRVGELRAAFNPESATTLFAATSSGLANPTVAPLVPEQVDSLRAAWFAVLDEPSYWKHRMHVFWSLIGPHDSPNLRGMAESPTVTGYADNPDLPTFASPTHDWFRRLIDVGFSFRLFAPIGYAVLCVIALVVCWRGMDHVSRRTVMLLVAASGCYALPLFVIAPSAETRYLLWPSLVWWSVSLVVALRRDVAIGTTVPIFRL